MEDASRKLYGVQWHPEVRHTEHGQELIDSFLHDCANLPADWNASNIIDEQIARIKAEVGRHQVICGLSGGVDSAVAAALVHRAIGDQLTCVFVDHGLLRKGEVEQVRHDFVEATGIRLMAVDASEDFLSALKGVSEPERKRKIIGERFIRTFERAARDIVAKAGEKGEKVKFLVQGTLYPDVVESGGGDGAANIKSHHNVGGLPKDLDFKLIEPLRTLFKDEVRAIGTELGLPDEIVWRQPFPGPGLGIRIIGDITRERLETLREADAIAREELSKAGIDRQIWQCPVVLLANVHSVGVQGDERTYGSPIVLRPVSSEDAMTADWSHVPYEVLGQISNRITNECRGINRVALDVTSKPPATIEWE
ncbi:MAG: glutamine-hydrolyzing GMP synthase, partial [Bifidobacterium sp.]